MAEELGWSSAEKARQIKVAQEYIGEFGGPVADKRGATLKAATSTDRPHISFFCETSLSSVF